MVFTPLLEPPSAHASLGAIGTKDLKPPATFGLGTRLHDVPFHISISSDEPLPSTFPTAHTSSEFSAPPPQRRSLPGGFTAWTTDHVLPSQCNARVRMR